MMQKRFQILRDDLQKAIDVDASDGRSVPINMNFIDEGFLNKDKGFIITGNPIDVLTDSLFYYQKKSGVDYFIRRKGRKLQRYYFDQRVWDDLANCPIFTDGKEFGYVVYNDDLYLGNGTESMYKFDGTTFTEYASAPKGNLFEIFEDRLFIAGVDDEPLTAYYSNVGVPTTFTPTDIIAPLGTDHITNLKNYYGSLLIFKEDSIHKITFVYDQVVTLFIPKVEVQSGTYGACSKKSVTWVENDLWFFTGQEVRAIGFKENQQGVLGVNRSVISEPIKETLKLISVENYSKITVFYNDRKFYLVVPIDSDELNVTFVCHTLYANSWTKYSGRDKAKSNSFVQINGIIYSSSADVPYGVIKWTVEDSDKEDITYQLVTE